MSADDRRKVLWPLIKMHPVVRVAWALFTAASTADQLIEWYQEGKFDALEEFIREAGDPRPFPRRSDSDAPRGPFGSQPLTSRGGLTLDGRWWLGEPKTAKSRRAIEITAPTLDLLRTH